MISSTILSAVSRATAAHTDRGCKNCVISARAIDTLIFVIINVRSEKSRPTATCSNPWQLPHRLTFQCRLVHKWTLYSNQRLRGTSSAPNGQHDRVPCLQLAWLLLHFIFLPPFPLDVFLFLSWALYHRAGLSRPILEFFSKVLH